MQSLYFFISFSSMILYTLYIEFYTVVIVQIFFFTTKKNVSEVTAAKNKSPRRHSLLIV
jgi:hypothetical protein